jgi:CRP-like cAMP-binding protein
VTQRDNEENLLVRRLVSIAALTEEECDAIRHVPIASRDLPARSDIVREGDSPTHCCLLLAGFAFRYKIAAEGRRQILAIHVPGDVPDLQSLHLTAMDHTLAALTPVRVGFIPHEALHEVNARYPHIAGALWRETLIDASIFREWMVGLGQRDALRRTAHFLCEMLVRLGAVGLASGSSVELPVTQVELADVLGMSAVHINRTIQELRTRRLITLEGKNLILLDRDGLEKLGDFDPAYLHINPRDRPALP